VFVRSSQLKPAATEASVVVVVDALVVDVQQAVRERPEVIVRPTSQLSARWLVGTDQGVGVFGRDHALVIVPMYPWTKLAPRNHQGGS
jgi:hypothetical protein